MCGKLDGQGNVQAAEVCEGFPEAADADKIIGVFAAVLVYLYAVHEGLPVVYGQRDFRLPVLYLPRLEVRVKQDAGRLGLPVPGLLRDTDSPLKQDSRAEYVAVDIAVVPTIGGSLRRFVRLIVLDSLALCYPFGAGYRR